MSHSIQDIRRHWLDRLGLCAVLITACFAFASHGVLAADKDKDKPKGNEISRVIAKEMTAAQKAMQANQWNEALKNLEAAETKSPLTTFDKKTIFDFKGFAYIKLNKMKEAETAYEAAIATGAYPADELAKVNKMMFRITAQNQQYPKAIEFGKQVADSGAASADDLAIMAQLYYLQKDCKNSAVWADKSISASRKTGETPKENLYLFKLQCASDASDNAAMAVVLYDLIRLTNKPSHWNTLLRIERQDLHDDRSTLQIDRLMYDTKGMTQDTDFIELAQLLGDQGLPGEAANVLDAVLASPAMKDEHKERTNRLLNSLKTRAETDKKGMAQLDADAAKNANGNISLSAGELHYALGDYPAAVTALTAAIQKGQLKKPDDAYVYLGRSQAALKNYPEAKKAFAQLKTVPGVNPKIAKVWDLYGETLGHQSN
jgi:predicted negative regulator of RcsB-dependent stress response